jgi:hypothetical protein
MQKVLDVLAGSAGGFEKICDHRLNRVAGLIQEVLSFNRLD